MESETCLVTVAHHLDDGSSVVSSVILCPEYFEIRCLDHRSYKTWNSRLGLLHVGAMYLRFVESTSSSSTTTSSLSFWQSIAKSVKLIDALDKYTSTSSSSSVTVSSSASNATPSHSSSSSQKQQQQHHRSASISSRFASQITVASTQHICFLPLHTSTSTSTSSSSGYYFLYQVLLTLTNMYKHTCI